MLGPERGLQSGLEHELCVEPHDLLLLPAVGRMANEGTRRPVARQEEGDVVVLGRDTAGLPTLVPNAKMLVSSPASATWLAVLFGPLSTPVRRSARHLEDTCCNKRPPRLWHAMATTETVTPMTYPAATLKASTSLMGRHVRSHTSRKVHCIPGTRVTKRGRQHTR